MWNHLLIWIYNSLINSSSTQVDALFYIEYILPETFIAIPFRIQAILRMHSWYLSDRCWKNAMYLSELEWKRIPIHFCHGNNGFPSHGLKTHTFWILLIKQLSGETIIQRLCTSNTKIFWWHFLVHK